MVDNHKRETTVTVQSDSTKLFKLQNQFSTRLQALRLENVRERISFFRGNGDLCMIAQHHLETMCGKMVDRVIPRRSVIVQQGLKATEVGQIVVGVEFIAADYS